MVQESHRDGDGGGPARPTLPPDIRQNRDLNGFLGIFLVATAVLPALPIYTEIKRSGFRRVDEWPDVFLLMGLISVAFVAIGLRLLFVSRPLGAGLTFHEGGFTIRVRRHIDMRDERYDWPEIAEVGMERKGINLFLYEKYIWTVRRADGAVVGD